jgi:hypothetical protein
VRLAVALILPALAVGVLLAAYNYGRFGNVLEFGDHYQLAVANIAPDKFVRASFIAPNLKWYYFSFPNLSPYFPYLNPLDTTARPQGYVGLEYVHGQWIAMILGLAAAALVIHRLIRGGRIPSALSAYTGFLLFASLCIFGATSALAVHADRYVVDFQGIGVLGLAIAVGWAAEEISCLWRIALGVLIFLTVSFNLLFPFGDSARGFADRPAT